LDAELLALRSMRDEEIGIRPGEFDATGDGDDDIDSAPSSAAAASSAHATGSSVLDDSSEEDQEFQQLLQYKPRCTFRARECTRCTALGTVLHSCGLT
jgi:hypothetical protein